VLPSADCGFEMNRPEAGRRRQDDVVRVGREHLLVRVEPGELAILRHVDLRGVILAPLLERRRQPIGECVAHCHELHTLRAVERIEYRAGPAAAAANQADPDGVSPRGCAPGIAGPSESPSVAAVVVLMKSRRDGPTLF